MSRLNVSRPPGVAAESEFQRTDPAPLRGERAHLEDRPAGGLVPKPVVKNPTQSPGVSGAIRADVQPHARFLWSRPSEPAALRNGACRIRAG